MARDYKALVASLRRKAADPVVPDAERAALLERAKTIEKNHPEAVTVFSPFIDDTILTSRDGRGDWSPWGPPRYESHGGTRFTKPNPKPGDDPDFDKRTGDAWDELWRLHRTQASWNPPPEEDIVEEDYRNEPDEDYGYDIFEGEEYE